MKWFPFFKLGKHTASSGAEFDATTEKLDKIIEMNKGREMPIAIGHPKTSSPAWGWVNELKRTGDTLYAKPKGLVAEFGDMVKKGMFKNVSVSLNEDLTIRHFGFLGATPPAIEGLQAEFAADDKAIIIEFSDWRMTTIGRIFQRIREYIIAKDGAEAADKVISNYEIEDIEREPEVMPAQTSFSKPEGGDVMAKTVAELEAELAAEKAKTAEFAKDAGKVVQLETELATEKKKNQVAEFSAFFSSDAMKKKVSPAMRELLLPIMEFAAASTAPIEFNAPDPADAAKTVKVAKAAVELVKEFCKAYLPDIITAEEIARKDAAGKGGDVKAQRDAAEMEFSKANPNLKYSEVVLAVSKEKPELYQDR